MKHGKWVYGKDIPSSDVPFYAVIEDGVYCSNCGEPAVYDWGERDWWTTPYCPMCGAKMEDGLIDETERCKDCAYLVEDENGNWVCDDCGKDIHHISDEECSAEQNF
ncbi:MAG: hypothetical protein J6T96_05405 [Bacteroidales bacterium]|nr:hypothetical protein [Bacteroidales bacterium]